MVVACFTPKPSASASGEWSVGYVKSDTFVQDKMGAFTVIAEEMAWQMLLWLLWCGSTYHMLVCGKQFSSIPQENHREHSVLPTDEETAIGEME